MFKDKTVLITGASSGIGAELARRFARGGAKLALVARRGDRLRTLADEIVPTTADTGQTPRIIVADLVEPGACERAVAETRDAFGRVDVLVNNAGIGEYGTFAEKDLPATERMMQLNMSALVRLTHLVLPEMLSGRRGWIMNIASAAAFQPTPYMGVYGATKAFVLSFSMSLWEEVRRAGVVVTCVCPGPVRTGFFDRGGYEARHDFTRFAVEADWVADRAYRALVRKKPVFIPDRLNRLSRFLQRFIPLKAVAKLAGKVLG